MIDVFLNHCYNLCEHRGEIMKTNKGFTLPELLGIIALIGIIAMITTTAVSKTISDSKVSAAKDSAHGYIRAVETAISHDSLENPFKIYDGNYTVDGSGNIVKGSETIIVGHNGTTPTGSLVITNDTVSSATLTIGKYTATYDGQDVTIK